MSGPIQLALMVGPLAVYLYALGIWHSGRAPRVVPGPVDCALLLLALGGLIVFGPIGQALLGRTIPRPGASGCALLIGGLGLVSLPWLKRSSRRLVVYNVDARALDRAVAAALDESPGAFTKTLRGFEDRQGGRGVVVEAARTLRAGTVEVFGSDPAALIAWLGPRLRARLQAEGAAPPSPMAWVFLILCLVLMLPVLGSLLSRPQAREALRALFPRLGG